MNVIKRIVGVISILVLLSGCTQLVSEINPSTEISPTNTPSSSTPTIGSSPGSIELSTGGQQTGDATLQTVETTPNTCVLVPVTQPPMPDKTFGPNELDPENGLHVTGLLQWIDIATYRLKVTGLVDHPLSLTYDELRCLPQVTANPDLICLGVFSDQATWTGVPIKYLLELAGVQKGASFLTLVSADGYQVKVPLEEARAEDNFLAYEVNGKTLPVQHGFPLRAVFSSLFGSYWVKWLVEIQIS